MNYSSTTDLLKKDTTARGTAGLQGYIRGIINEIPPGKSLAMATIVKDLLDNNKVPNKHQAYVRVGNAIASLKKTHTKAINKVDGYTYVVRIEDVEEGNVAYDTDKAKADSEEE